MEDEMKPEIVPEVVREFLDYNPDTGVFTWRERRRKWFQTDRRWKTWNTRYANTVAGSVNKTTRDLAIRIFRCRYMAHRLAWLYVHGRWPKDQIDHINHIRTDNRIVNLREATHQENGKNRPANKNNTSGTTGVCWDKATKKWEARIKHDGKQFYGGQFADIEKAVSKRKEMEVSFGFHKNHGGKVNE